MPTPRRYPDRTMTGAERAKLSRARLSARLARYETALAHIATTTTDPAAREAAREALADAPPP